MVIFVVSERKEEHLTCSVNCHRVQNILIALSHLGHLHTLMSYTHNGWAIAIQSGLYTICAPHGDDWSRALGWFSWTLHKTGGCWRRSFISCQPPQAEAGHFLSLTYVLYKPRQCPTNTGFFFLKKSLYHWWIVCFSLPGGNESSLVPHPPHPPTPHPEMQTSIKGE